VIAPLVTYAVKWRPRNKRWLAGTWYVREWTDLGTGEVLVTLKSCYPHVAYAGESLWQRRTIEGDGPTYRAVEASQRGDGPLVLRLRAIEQKERE